MIYNVPLLSLYFTTQQMTSLNQMENEWEARLSVAGSATAAVQQMNQVERQSFMDMCNQERIHLLNYIAWDFRHVRVYIYFFFY